MKKNRLEAFSDGVFAIIITIMVLGLEAPKGHTFYDLIDLIPTFISYILSFIFIATYWINHHRLFQIVRNINSRILWANFNLLFWLSLIPFATDWLGNQNTNTAPVLLYSLLILISGFSYKLLVNLVIKNEEKNELLVNAFIKNQKAIYERALNAIAIVTAFIHPNMAIFILVLVAIARAIPNKKLNQAYAELAKEERNTL